MTDYNLGPVKPWVASAAQEFGTFFGLTTIGGYRTSATDPNGHPAGRALDLMTPSTAVGDRIAAFAQKHWKRLGIEYIIWKQRIWSVARAGEGWRPMEDRGSATANHMDHVHVNFTATAPSGSRTSMPMQPGTTADTIGSSPGPSGPGTTGTTGTTSPQPPGATSTNAGASGTGSIQDQVVKVVIVAGVVLTGVALIAAGAARATRPAREAASEDVGDAASTAAMFVPQLRAAGAAAQLSKGTRT